MSIIEGSRAHQAFDDARAYLRTRQARAPRRFPAADVRTLFGPPPSPGERPDATPGAASAEDGPLHQAWAAIELGEVSSRDLVTAALAAVDDRNDELVAIVEVCAERALAEADRLDAETASGRRRSPLHGVPVTVKDVIDVAGLPTRAGSAAYLDVPEVDAAAVARLRQAGAVVIGKASTHEFALGVTSPQSRNPHDPTRLPGGSSGGSAIAVSTGMGLASLGTDTRASIRVPAALCGVVGLKPTYHRVPVAGIVPLSWSMDHVAPMATTVADAGLVLDVLGAADHDDWWRREFSGHAGTDVTGLRVGVPSAAFAGADPGVAGAVATAVEALSDLGCVVDGVTRPDADDFDLANYAGLVISRCEAATFHRALGLDRSRYWEEVAEQLAEADAIGAGEYLDAQRLRHELVLDFCELFEQVDVLALPTCLVTAPPVDDFAAYLMVLARNAIPWAMLGFPALSVPCGQVDGLPVGLQLVAPPWREDRLVALGSAYERTRRPA